MEIKLKVVGPYTPTFFLIKTLCHSHCLFLSYVAAFCPSPPRLKDLGCVLPCLRLLDLGLLLKWDVYQELLEKNSWKKACTFFTYNSNYIGSYLPSDDYTTFSPPDVQLFPRLLPAFSCFYCHSISPKPRVHLSCIFSPNLNYIITFV